jgi:NADH-quinone oxidoreductase subunit J
MGEAALNAVFYALAAMGVACAVAVCASRNIVRSAFALLGVLAAAAGFYILAYADFLFAVQILIYIGGILVLVIFAIMLTHRIRDVNLSNDSTHGLGSFLICACMAFALIMMILRARWEPYEQYKAEQAARTGAADGMILPRQADQPREIGRDLTGSFLLPFEAISVLLLAALIGAAYLARKEVRGGPG